MLYGILKIWGRLTLRVFCRHIIIRNREYLKARGPLLLACNHPNSFLDSVIINLLFDQPVWSLARGDVFKKPFYIRLLRSLRIMPVYRTSEGVENLSENYKTFDECIRLFRQGAIITIFSEGKCINEWHLRPLKKGTARLAIKAWQEGIPLQVLPVGINYSSFRSFGKNVIIGFGTPLTASSFNLAQADGPLNLQFNSLLRKELEKLVFEIPEKDRALRREKLYIPAPRWKKIILALPALAGWLLHLPLMLPIKKFTSTRTIHTDHYDSVMMALVLVLYPLYLGLFFLIPFRVSKSFYTLLLPPLMMFCAWSYVQLKPQSD